MSGQLTDKRVCILAENDFEDIELLYPLHRFREEGAQVVVVGPEKTRYTGKHGCTVDADLAAAEGATHEFDIVVVPGGYAPDHMRRNRDLLEIVRRADAAGHPVAAICHAAWVLISAHTVSGRQLTCFPSVREDVTNAGGEYLDQSVVVDGNLITSRFPADLGDFCRAIIDTATA